MAGWSGFTDDDLRKMRQTSDPEPSGSSRRVIMTRHQQQQQQQQQPQQPRGKTLRSSQTGPNTGLTPTKQQTVNSIDPSMKLSPEPRNINPSSTGSPTNSGLENRIKNEINVPYPEDGNFSTFAGDVKVKPEMKEDNEGGDSVSGHSSLVDNSDDVIELDENEALSVERGNVQKFQQRQKVIEEANKRKRNLLAKAIEDRRKKAKAEANKLMKVQQELSHLDTLLTADVSIIRDRIEVASLEYMDAQIVTPDASVNSAKKRIKKPNYTERENIILLQEIGKHKLILQSSLHNGRITNIKAAIWSKITDKVNAVGGFNRTVGQIRTRWKVLKSAVLNKVKNDGYITGGTQFDYVPYEEAILAILDTGSSQIDGTEENRNGVLGDNSPDIENYDYNEMLQANIRAEEDNNIVISSVTGGETYSVATINIDDLFGQDSGTGNEPLQPTNDGQHFNHNDSPIVIRNLSSPASRGQYLQDTKNVSGTSTNLPSLSASVGQSIPDTREHSTISTNLLSSSFATKQSVVKSTDLPSSSVTMEQCAQDKGEISVRSTNLPSSSITTGQCILETRDVSGRTTDLPSSSVTTGQSIPDTREVSEVSTSLPSSSVTTGQNIPDTRDISGGSTSLPSSSIPTEQYIARSTDLPNFSATTGQSVPDTGEALGRSAELPSVSATSEQCTQSTRKHYTRSTDLSTLPATIEQCASDTSEVSEKPKKLVRKRLSVSETNNDLMKKYLLSGIAKNESVIQLNKIKYEVQILAKLKLEKEIQKL